MKQKSIKTILYALIIIFVLLFVFIFAPFPDEYKRTLLLFAAILALIFLILGIALIYATIKLKIKRPLKIFLLLTGISAAGILPSAVLHNLVYALLIVLFGEGFWNSGDEPVFFILAIIILPLLFIISAIASMIILHRKKK